MTNSSHRSGEGGWGAARADLISSGSLEWSVDWLEGSPDVLIAAGIPANPRRLVRWCDPVGEARVLGSGSAEARLPHDPRDSPRVVRRSGGATVRVAPHRLVWADVVLPRSDRLWVDDVGLSSRWLGEVWAAALVDLGVDRAEPFAGPIIRNRDVCFAGIAPGEVVVDGRKVVGISQRRTREAALFQCAVMRHPDPDEVAAVGLAELLAGGTADAAIRTAFERRLRSV